MSEEVEQLLAEALAEEASELGDVEQEGDGPTGPEDAGEDDLGYEEDDDADDEGELEEEGHDLEGGEEEDDQGEDEDEGDEPEPEPEPEAAPESSEVAELKARTALLEDELRLVRQERLDRAKALPQRPAIDPQLTEAVRVAFYGSAEQLREFPREIQEKAVKQAREANDLQVLQATDPVAYYHKVFGPIVDDHIRHRTQKFEEQSAQERDNAVVDKHRDYLSQGGALDRVSGILETLPSGGTFEARLALAVELDQGRSGSVSRAKKDQRSKSRDRDLAANKNGKRRRGRGRRRSGGRPKAPERNIDDVMGDVAYLQQLEKEGKL